MRRWVQVDSTLFALCGRMLAATFYAPLCLRVQAGEHSGDRLTDAEYGLCAHFTGNLVGGLLSKLDRDLPVCTLRPDDCIVERPNLVCIDEEGRIGKPCKRTGR